MKTVYSFILSIALLLVTQSVWAFDSRVSPTLSTKQYNEVLEQNSSNVSGTNKTSLTLINSVTSSDIPENVEASGFGFMHDNNGYVFNLIALSGESDHQYVDTKFTSVTLEAGLSRKWPIYVYDRFGIMSGVALTGHLLVGLESQTIESEARGINWDFARPFTTAAVGFNKRFNPAWDMDFKIHVAPATKYSDTNKDISAESQQPLAGFSLTTGYYFGGSKNYGISAGISNFSHSAFTVSLTWRT